ncbi:MAG TPA: helix-turn-helix transcriptional regulator [Gemmatimonadaceae bacterium]
MPKGDFLGEFEIIVLGAVLRLGEESYGMRVRQEIEGRIGRAASIGAVYATLERLQEKRLVAFEVSDPRPVPGGRARKFYRLTTAGAKALSRSRRALTLMFDGLDPEPGR